VRLYASVRGTERAAIFAFDADGNRPMLLPPAELSRSAGKTVRAVCPAEPAGGITGIGLLPAGRGGRSGRAGRAKLRAFVYNATV
jgi:hypothetical protein